MNIVNWNNNSHSFNNHSEVHLQTSKQAKQVMDVFIGDTVDQYTIMSGDRAKIKDLLFNRLIECGWRDEVRLLCRNTLLEQSASNNNNITVDQLISEVTPKARSLVPDAVKQELLAKIRKILAETGKDTALK